MKRTVTEKLGEHESNGKCRRAAGSVRGCRGSKARQRTELDSDYGQVEGHQVLRGAEGQGSARGESLLEQGRFHAIPFKSKSYIDRRKP